MIRPTVEVILSYVDKLTAPLRGTSTGVRGLFSDMTKSVTSFVGGFLAIGSITAYMRSAWEAADRFNQSLARVEGTAKIVGVPLEDVRATAAKAREEFGLSATAANNFASSAVTMAAKAGDVSKSGELMAAVLNLAAARGISADEALEALNITLKGQDEGLDKLVQKNPSAYYDSWAKAAGRSAGSLTDLEKKLAIVDGLISDGAPVRGAYTDWLQTTAGKAFLAGQAMEEANAKFGVATESLRTMLLGAKVWAAEALGSVVEFFQKMGVDMALAFDTAGYKIKHAVGSILQFVAEGIAGNRVLLTFMTEGMVSMVDDMANAGNRMMVDAIRDKRTVEGIRKEMYAEIEGAHALAEMNMTAASEQGAEDRGKISAAEKKREADAAKALIEMRRDVLVGGMTALGQELLKLDEELKKALQTSDEKARDEAESLTKIKVARVMAAHAKLDELVPRLANTNQRMLQITTDWGGKTETAVRATHEVWDELRMEVSAVAGGIEGAADELLAFAYEAGAANDQVINLVGGVANLAGGIKSISGATDFASLLGGIGTVFAGVQGLLGGLFGDSPAEQARKALLAENSKRLRELKDHIGDLMNMNTPGAMLAKFESLSGMDPLLGGGNSMTDERQRFAAFAQTLASQGLFLSDAEDLAKNLGIDLGIGEGRLSKGALQQFLDAIDNAEFSQFDQSFAGQQDFIETLMGVGGNSNPQDRLNLITNRLLGPQGAFAFFAPLLGAGQANTAEGRAGIRDAFLDALNQMNAGGFDTALFGQLSGADFVKTMQTIADLFTEMDSASGAPAAPSTSPVVTAPVVATSAGTFVPTAPQIEVPGAPAVLREGVTTDLGDLLGGKLDTMIDQGAEMIALQRRIAVAAEASAGRPTIAIGAIHGSDPDRMRMETTEAMNEALRTAHDLAAVTQGAG